MKKLLLFVFISFGISSSTFSQLPAAAQALYDSAYNQDPVIVDYALNNGAQIFATPDGNSFYLQWFPVSANPSTSPLVVSLHGSHCNVFMEFKSWHTQAQLHGCGIIALQWYRYNENPPLDYFPDDTLYSYIDSALTNINYSAKALLHGFSRGSARSYAMIFNDIQSGKNYFCTTVSNSGGADLGYPLYADINNGVYGSAVFAGKHFNLYCGGLDTIVGCTKMADTQTWLQTQGGSVDVFIQDPLADHNGFQIPSANQHKNTFLNNYLQCYNSVVTLKEESIKQSCTIFPNPFSEQTSINTSRVLKNACLTIYNVFGQQIKQVPNISGQTIHLQRNGLTSGVYFIQLTQEGKTIASNKLIVTD